MAASVHYLTDTRGKKTAVVLSLKKYRQLLEDLADLAAVADRRDEPLIPHDKFIRELKKDGILADL